MYCLVPRSNTVDMAHAATAARVAGMCVNNTCLTTDNGDDL